MDTMSPDGEDCETAQLNVEDAVPVHYGWRVLPEEQLPALAWTENEAEKPIDNTNSPGENRRLLPTVHQDRNKSKLQAGLTLGVHTPRKYTKCLTTSKSQKTKKSMFEKRKEKIATLLKPPYFIVTMIIVIVLVHLWASTELRTSLQWCPNSWWKQPWRLVTYGFLHASNAHLALNALVALAVGWPLEREQSWWRVIIIWFGGVSAGALGAGVFQPGVNVVGASAAIYALLTAHLANVSLRFGHVALWWFRPLSVCVLVTSEVCYSFIRASTPEPGVVAAHAQGSFENVSWPAHLFGAAVGVPLAFIVFAGENTKQRHVLVCRVVSAMMLLAGLIVSTFHYIHAANESSPHATVTLLHQRHL